ncbi:MAG: LysM peptidoglycan-binding domain-containing protein [Deltaproteobacteria bacterium]|nr:MAG: LysM peptidoglycan-binding domain-containing protein [Deltaproteobacteria bacterium]
MAPAAGDNKKAFFLVQDSASGDDGKCFYVQFNPKEFSLDESAGWSDGKSADDKETSTTAKDAFLTYDKGTPVTVSMELVFDTTDTGDDLNEKWIKPLRGFLHPSVDDKDDQENPIVRPPYIVFKWGSFELPCVIESLGVSYLMFKPNGDPLRAKVSVGLKEREDQEMKLSNMQPIVLTAMGSMLSSGKDAQAEDPAAIQAQTGTGQHSSKQPGNLATSRTVKANEFKPTKTYVTQEGETLSDVAAKTGGDFEDIAKANNIDNPMELEPGTELVIPPSSQMAAVFQQNGKSEGPAKWGDFKGNLNEGSDLADGWDTAPSEFSFKEQESEELGMEYTPYTRTTQASVFEHKSALEAAADSFASQLSTYAKGEANSEATEAALDAGAPISKEGAQKMVTDNFT